jgi:hypothetical protein
MLVMVAELMVLSLLIVVVQLLLPASSPPGRRTGAAPRLLGRNGTRLLVAGPKPSTHL